MADRPTRPETRDHRDQPTYWFAVLEIAREQDNYELAAEAQRQLGRLGVRVVYDRGRTRKRAAR